MKIELSDAYKLSAYTWLKEKQLLLGGVSIIIFPMGSDQPLELTILWR